MYIMLEERKNKSSLVADLQPPLPPITSKTPPLSPLPVPNTVPTISAATVETLASAFPDLSTKVQLNRILNRK